MSIGKIEVTEGALDSGKWDISLDNYLYKEGLLFHKSLPLGCISAVEKISEQSGLLGKTIEFKVSLVNETSFSAKSNTAAYQKIYEAQHNASKKDVVLENRVNKSLVWSVVVIAVFYIFIASGHKDKSANGNAAAVSSESSTEAPIEIKGSEISAEYDQNEARADAIFKGRAIRITGIVTAIDKDVTDDIVVRLKGLNEFQSVHAEVKESEANKAINLQKGQKVVMQCTGKGEIIGSPMLGECIIL